MPKLQNSKFGWLICGSIDMSKVNETYSTNESSINKQNALLNYNYMQPLPTTTTRIFSNRVQNTY